MAFKEAGIRNPREEVSMWRSTTVFHHELTVYEDLQIRRGARPSTIS